MKKIARLRRPPIDWLDSSVEKIIENNGKITQKNLVERIDVGQRHFRRKFKEVIGVLPKYFCKVVYSL